MFIISLIESLQIGFHFQIYQKNHNVFTCSQFLIYGQYIFQYNMDIPQSNLCKVQGHKGQQLIPYLCTAQRCDQISRYMCQECLVDFIHSHNGQKPQILSKEKLRAQFNSNIVELKQRHQDAQQAFEQQNKQTLQILSEIEYYNKEQLIIRLDENILSDQTKQSQINSLNQQLLIFSRF
ncbi:hypothetical protein pb186bvf_008005 [Paramecium bursaria]